LKNSVRDLGESGGHLRGEVYNERFVNDKISVIKSRGIRKYK
jgi:hypothetical protein